MSSQSLSAGVARKAALAMLVATLLYVWALTASLGAGTGLAGLAHLLGFGGARQATVAGINIVLEPWLLLAAMSPRPPRAHVLAPAS